MPYEIIYLDGDMQPLPQWQEGEPVPHLRFDGLEQLTRVILCGLGRDLVYGHGVPKDVAQRAMEDWAGELYNLYREP